MHLHDLLCDGEPKTRTTLGLAIRAIDLMKLVKYARLMFHWDAGAGVDYADIEVAVYRFGCHADLTHIRELDSVANQVQEHLSAALLVADAKSPRF